MVSGIMNRFVIAAVDDLFFASKIRTVAEQLGIKIRFARSADAAVEAAKTEKPDLIVVDLNSKSCEPLDLARRLKAEDSLRSVTLLGFFSHVQTELRQQAQEAGYDRLLPRSAFSERLPSILQGD
jgi:CheY-like chemotaxis protein